MTYYISARTARGLLGFYVDGCDSFTRAFELGEAKLFKQYRGPFVIVAVQRMPDLEKEAAYKLETVKDDRLRVMHALTRAIESQSHLSWRS
jgi:hypothetical protein